MKVAVIGAGGQLGSDLVKVFEDVVALGHKDIEVTDPSSCEVLQKIAPDAVINTAAFHRTDGCENEPEKAFEVNAIGALNVARICSSIGAVNVYISTDYVFSGTSGHYYEEDPVRPINVYGSSKLAGEVLTRAYSPEHYILRVSSLFGTAGASGKGGNFIETMIRNVNKEDGLKVVDDVVMSPTYTLDAAEAIRAVLERGLRFDTYHVTNYGSCSWFEFAQAIFQLLGKTPAIHPIISSEYPTLARRPSDSSLSNHRLREAGIEMRFWKDALKAYLVEKGHIQE
ncbi:MAG: dTDP-4-dehydrorhamnose reductase [Methanomassiliicoccales archaeon]|nr:dTDP-4-dehydrorhamnose reductase [Methanomassiliicoccales archaeon]NYT15875.1 dTDP-4-dehydrorhamnose reductase [Methanomassiliicoccales archaeon]